MPLPLEQFPLGAYQGHLIPQRAKKAILVLVWEIASYILYGGGETVICDFLMTDTS